MLPESKVQEIHEFTNLFFNRVIDRLKQAGAPDKEYVQPKINLFRSLDQGEKDRLEELCSRIGSRLVEESNQYHKPEEWGSRKKELVQELLTEEERTELSDLGKRDKWGKNVLGIYDRYTDDITLDESVWKDSWGILAHELLHAVRYKVLKDLTTDTHLEDNVPVSIEVSELFGELELIVRADVFPNYPRYVEDVNWSEQLKLHHLEKRYDFFKEGIKSRFSKMVSTLVVLHRKMLECNGNLNINDTPEYKQITLDLHPRYMDELYLKWICGIPKVDIEGAYVVLERLYLCIEAEQYAIKNCGLDGKSRNIPNEQKKTKEITRCFNTKKIINHQKDDEYRQKKVYWVAKLAINEFQPEFTHSWPQLFLMPGKEVEERYITPIRKRMEELRAPL